jgi:glycosyltransferase involved in cell wall biosynthesis
VAETLATAAPPETDGPVRVLRVIARMCVGGPAHHVSLLGGRLDADRWDTLLVHGNVGPGEGSLAHLAEKEGCRVHPVDSLGPEIDPAADSRSLRALVEVINSYRPQIVHTHTAKAGFLGRTAALMARGPRPVIVHTFHGHVLEGYFGPAKNAAYRTLERRLARVSDTLIGVADATVEDLVRLRVAPRERFRVVPLGLDLDRFAAGDADAGAAFRDRSGTQPGEVLIAFTGRLVPIKRVDVLLRAFAALRAEGHPVRLAITGDGPCRAELEQLATELEVAGHVAFHGFVSDPATVTSGADIAALSSDNEGTPVALIEAAAAGVPAVATAVGGVPEVVTPATGLIVPPGDPDALASALRRLTVDVAVRRSMGQMARQQALERFSVQRLVGDIDGLYSELLAVRNTTHNGRRRGSRAVSLPMAGRL